MTAKTKIRKINAELAIAFEDRREIKTAITHYEQAAQHESDLVRIDARKALGGLLRELSLIEGEINRLFLKRRKITENSVRINRIIDVLSAS